MPKIIKSLLAWSVISLFLIYVGYFFYQNPQRLQQLFQLSAGQIAILLFLSLGAFFCLGLQLSISIQPFATRLSLLEAFSLSITNNLLNYSPIKSGAIARGYYLKSVHQLSVHHYVQALFAGQLLWIAISAILGILAGLNLLRLIQVSGNLGLGLILAILVAALCLASGSLLLSQHLHRFFKSSSTIQAYVDGIRTWIRSSGVKVNFSLASCLLFLLFSLRLWYVFYLAGETISFGEAVFLQSCVAVGFAFSFVPGNLGLKEGVLVGLAVMLGIDAETAVLAAVLDRAASLLPTLLLGPVFLHRLTNNVLRREVTESP